MVRVAANQGNIAFWAQARAEDACNDFYAATNALNSFCQREAEPDLDSTSNDEDDNDDEGGGVCRGPGSPRGKDASEEESSDQLWATTLSPHHVICKCVVGLRSTQPMNCFPELPN